MAHTESAWLQVFIRWLAAIFPGEGGGADGAFGIYTFFFDTALEDSPTGAGFIRLRMDLQ